MKLSGAVIFYWVQKDFPGAKHLNSRDDGLIKYARPIFPSSPADMSKHIVVFREQTSEHFVSLPPDALPVFIGSEPGCTGEAILLPKSCDCAKVFNTLQKIFDRFQNWKLELEQAVHQKCSFDAIIQSCDSLLDDPMCLADNHFRYVSYSRKLAQSSGYEEKYVGEGNYLPLDYINQLTAMPDFSKSEEYQDVYQYNCVGSMLHKNIFYHGVFVGRLALPLGESETRNRYHYQILRYVSEYVEQLYEIIGSFWHRKTTPPRLSALLLTLLEGKQVEMDVLNRLMINQGYRNGDELRLIQMRSHFITNESKMTPALTSQLEKLWPGSCCMILQQQVIVFLNLSHYKRFTNKLFNQELAVFLRESLLLAGISRSFTDIRWIQAAYQQTEIALDAGEELTPTYWYFKYDDYAYWDLLHHGCRNFLPEQICHPAINVLRNYDKENNTELSSTLKAYIANQYNAVGTANELCVARSTFLKRLARIEELTKVELTNYQTRLYLAISFELFDQYYENSTR